MQANNDIIVHKIASDKDSGESRGGPGGLGPPS